MIVAHEGRIRGISPTVREGSSPHLEFCKSYHKAFARCCHGTSADYTDFTDQSVSHKKAQKAGRDSQGNPFCASCAFSWLISFVLRNLCNLRMVSLDFCLLLGAYCPCSM